MRLLQEGDGNWKIIEAKIIIEGLNSDIITKFLILDLIGNFLMRIFLEKKKFLLAVDQNPL
jgi:hypothetical protein